MAKQFCALTPEHRRFIARQHMFFTASAAAGGRVNLPPQATFSRKGRRIGKRVQAE